MQFLITFSNSAIQVIHSSLTRSESLGKQKEIHLTQYLSFADIYNRPDFIGLLHGGMLTNRWPIRKRVLLMTSSQGTHKKLK